MPLLSAASRFVIGAALLALAPLASAQTGKVSGRVVDAVTSEPLFGVAVLVGESGRGAATNADGYYDVVGVRPGTYDVRVSYVGYAPQTVEGVRVRIDQTTALDVALAEEQIEGQGIVVQATRPLVQRDRTSSESSVSAEDLEALPADVEVMTPGVLVQRDRRLVAQAGARGDE